MPADQPATARTVAGINDTRSVMGCVPAPYIAQLCSPRRLIIRQTGGVGKDVASVQTIIDTDLLLRHKKRALARLEPGTDFLMQRAVDDLEDRLGAVGRHFADAVALFCLTPDAARTIAGSGKADIITRVEQDSAFLGPDDSKISDANHLDLEPESADLIVTLLTLHEANDIPGQLIQIRRALRPDGLFLGVMAGAGTLAELRESLLAAETELFGGASPRILPFTDVRDAGALLQRAGFALPVADLETVTVRYGTMFSLMRDLRAMGAANALVDRSRKPATRALFMRAAEIYAERFSDPDGRIRATFSFVWFSGWAPHASQQKPLKPGSATLSLKQALEGPDAS
nr:methyltransferase domain-containing protein [Oryzicola mucosus]